MPGLDFSNYHRNQALHARGVPLPKATSTGTTIVGCIFDGGVVVRSVLIQASACADLSLLSDSILQSSVLTSFLVDCCRYESHKWTYSGR